MPDFPAVLPTLLGRRTVFLNATEITADNVKEYLNMCLSVHLMNVAEMEYLYWYRRGFQPILTRTKERNEFILNKVVVNNADRIVSFKDGYFLNPAFYTARNEKATEKVKILNEYLYRSGKQNADNSVVDWFHTVGYGVLYVKSVDNDETPVEVYSLDPRGAFVAYSLTPGNEPIMGVNMVVSDNRTYYDVYTKNKVFKLSGGTTGQVVAIQPPIESTAISLDAVYDNPLGEIPIIQYRYNTLNMCAFEGVISLLDQINNITSNRADGVEQFIQSLAVAVNCQFEEGTTADSIRKAGMLVLKSVGENKADFRILSEQLDQSQTQVLIDDLYTKVQENCAVPFTNRDRTYDSTGSAVMANSGYVQADASAKNTAELFREANKYFDRLFLKILKKKKGLDLALSDIELAFAKNEMANVQSKAQALQTMLAAGMNPILAFEKSGISDDPVNDVKMSEKYLELIWGKPNVEVIEKDTDVGEPM